MPRMVIMKYEIYPAYGLRVPEDAEDGPQYDVPEALIARWYAVIDELSAVKQALGDLYEDTPPLNCEAEEAP